MIRDTINNLEDDLIRWARRNKLKGKGKTFLDIVREIEEN